MWKRSYLLVGVLLTLCVWGTRSDAQTRYTIGKLWIQAQSYDSLVTAFVPTDTLILDRTNRDVKLYRSAANVLYSPDTLSVGGDLRTSGKIQVGGTADSLKSTRVWADSLILDITNRDVKLYRSAANVLYTPDTLSVAGNLYLANGSASAPSLAGVNDPNTGLNWATNDTLRIATGGSNRVTINPGGEFIVGTTDNGAYPFQVNGAGYVSTDLTINDQLIVSGTGPHAIGGATVTNYGLVVKPTVTAFGGWCVGVSTDGMILTPDGTNGSMYGLLMGGTLTYATTNNSYTNLLAVGMAVSGVAMTKTGNGTIANAAAFQVGSPPTIGTNNYSMWIDAGPVRMDDSLSVGTGAMPTAGLEVKGGVLIGQTATRIDTVLSATRTIDFPSIATETEVDSTITVTGALTGDVVWLGLPAAPAAGGIFQAFVSAANTVTIRFRNETAGNLDPASATYRVGIVNF